MASRRAGWAEGHPRGSSVLPDLEPLKPCCFKVGRDRSRSPVTGYPGSGTAPPLSTAPSSLGSKRQSPWESHGLESLLCTLECSLPRQGTGRVRTRHSRLPLVLVVALEEPLASRSSREMLADTAEAASAVGHRQARRAVILPRPSGTSLWPPVPYAAGLGHENSQPTGALRVETGPLSLWHGGSYLSSQATEGELL